MGDSNSLGAIIIFLVVMGANLLASLVKKSKANAKRARKPALPNTAAKPQRARAQRSEPLTGPSAQSGQLTRRPSQAPQQRARSAQAAQPAHQTRPKVQGQRSSEAPRRLFGPQPESPPTKEKQPPAPQESQLPDWAEILEDPFGELERRLTGKLKEAVTPPPPQQKPQVPIPEPPRASAPPARERKPLQPRAKARKKPVAKHRVQIPSPQAAVSAADGGETLRRAVIWFEILGPPMAKRPPGMRRLGKFSV